MCFCLFLACLFLGCDCSVVCILASIFRYDVKTIREKQCILGVYVCCLLSICVLACSNALVITCTNAPHMVPPKNHAFRSIEYISLLCLCHFWVFYGRDEQIDMVRITYLAYAFFVADLFHTIQFIFYARVFPPSVHTPLVLVVILHQMCSSLGVLYFLSRFLARVLPVISRRWMAG